MEIITGVERRRRWRLDEKLRIVAETEVPGACFMEIARRHEVSRGLLWNWRRQVRHGTLRAEPEPAFLPVRMANDPAPGLTISSQAARTPIDTRIEIALADGTVIRAGNDVSLPALRRAIAAVRG
jgi:transposase